MAKKKKAMNFPEADSWRSLPPSPRAKLAESSASAFNLAAEKPRFVVGVDFGTTFTSVSFASSATPEEVKQVRTWPNVGTGSTTSENIPTKIQYIKKLDTAVDSTNSKWEVKCGYEAEVGKANEPAVLEWFKILLQEPVGAATTKVSSGTGRNWGTGQIENPNPGINSLFGQLGVGSSSGPAGLSTTFSPPTISPAQKTAENLHDLNITPTEAVTEFLKYVRNTTVADIEQTYGVQFVRDSKIEYILTVPAIWSDSANSSMVKAATAAGFGRHRIDFDLVSEPESAASYTLKDVTSNNFKVGDTLLICDAGGGTVDLISYQIVGLRPLKLHEFVGGTGDLCGSIFLNHRFENYMRGLLGNDTIDAMKPRSRNEMMRTWEEQVKFKFGNTPKQEFDVAVPGIPDDPEKNIDDNYHGIKHEDVKMIFDPVIDRIIELVSQQVDQVRKKGGDVSAILLVGGFGASKYLLKRLQETRFRGTSINVHQPVNAGVAIARGALLRGLDGSIVKERKSRKFYGNEACVPYEPMKGWDSHKFYSFCDEVYLVPGSLHWYVKKGEVVGSNLSSQSSFFRTVLLSGSSQPNLKFDTELFCCNHDEPPEFRWQNPLAVNRVCTLHTDLSGIPLHKFEQVINSTGEIYLRVGFVLKMTLVNEVLSFECLFQGKRHGVVEAVFD